MIQQKNHWVFSGRYQQKIGVWRFEQVIMENKKKENLRHFLSRLKDFPIKSEQNT
jgi:hypothetical protein